jgi:hypothetical protein
MWKREGGWHERGTDSGSIDSNNGTALDCYRQAVCMSAVYVCVVCHTVWRRCLVINYRQQHQMILGFVLHTMNRILPFRWLIHSIGQVTIKLRCSFIISVTERCALAKMNGTVSSNFTKLSNNSLPRHKIQSCFSPSRRLLYRF